LDVGNRGLDFGPRQRLEDIAVSAAVRDLLLIGNDPRSDALVPALAFLSEDD